MMKIFLRLSLLLLFQVQTYASPIHFIDCNNFLLSIFSNRTLNLNAIESGDITIDQFQIFFKKADLSQTEILKAIERRKKDFNKISKHISVKVPKNDKLQEAIEYYSIWYDQINSLLRNKVNPKGAAGKFHKILSSPDFKTLPRVEGVVFRSTFLRKDIYQKILTDNLYEDLGYVSASLKPQSALAYIENMGQHEEYEKVLMLIQSRNGRYIAPLSELQKEEEVLFISGSKFALSKVLSDRENGFKILLLTEL